MTAKIGRPPLGDMARTSVQTFALAPYEKVLLKDWVGYEGMSISAFLRSRIGDVIGLRELNKEFKV